MESSFIFDVVSLLDDSFCRLSVFWAFLLLDLIDDFWVDDSSCIVSACFLDISLLLLGLLLTFGSSFIVFVEDFVSLKFSCSSNSFVSQGITFISESSVVKCIFCPTLSFLA